MCYLELKDRFACVDTPLKLLNLDILSEIDRDCWIESGLHGCWGLG